MNKKQINLNLYQGTHGGRRPNAGRKRLHSAGVNHKKRERVSPSYPMHINFKYSTYIRSEPVFDIFVRGIKNAQKHGLRILQYSVQSNHIHLIVEANTNEILKSSMLSMTVTIARSIKSLKHLSGSIQIERYHLHVLKTPSETVNAFNYVIFNEHHHTGQQRLNQFSSINGYLELDKPKSWLAKKATAKLLSL